MHLYLCTPYISSSFNPYILIRQNEVRNNQKGIYLNESSNAWVLQNEVFIPSHANATYNCVGIEAYLSGNHTIEHNEIYGLGTLPPLSSSAYWASHPTLSAPAESKKRGIVSRASDNNDIKCNYLENVSYNLVCEDDNPNTYFTGNEMKSGNRGFVVANNGVCYDQVSATTPCENIWSGTWAGYSKLFSFYSDNTNFIGFNQIFLRTPLQATPLDNGTTGFFPMMLTSVTIPNYPVDLCGDNGGGHSAMFFGNGGQGDSSTNNAYEMLAEATELTEAEAITLHNILLNKAYNCLKAGVELPLETEMVEAEAGVETAIGDIDFSSASTLNESMNTDFTASLISQQINRYRLANLQTFEWYPTDSEIEIITAIANLCPKNYGRGVYYARNILEEVLGIESNYEDACAETTQNSNRSTVPNPVLKFKSLGKAYPNPISLQNSKVFNVEVASTSSARLFSLHTGSILQEWKLETGIHALELPPFLLPGIYTLQFSDAKSSSSIKLVVQP
jgi:hypothetical protein